MAATAKRQSARKRYFILRYFSNRGTDQRLCVQLRSDITEPEALEVAKDWAQKQTAGTACHKYTVEAFETTVPPEAKWQAQWKSVCNRKREVDEEYANLRAVRMAHDWSQLY